MSLAIRRACKKSIDAWEKALVALIEQRTRERTALFEKAKARVVAIGAAR